ncbi:nucleotidyltransferase domain-containing protein [Metallosphaera hakonensis]|uniref:nucleotidyltransferase domain-containing protein n=1 Tax=Metallosphaera hakonensis TaxID=79601 RepID=UPI000A797A58|nr:nucleotidyltransferase domain-containing protein [Metallosphaera hakonensis]
MKLIILFGSRSRGDFTEHSDYDVLVVDDDIPKDPRRVSDQLYAKVLAMFPGEVDPVFMNSEVFLKKRLRKEFPLYFKFWKKVK